MWQPHLKAWEFALEILGLVAVPLFLFYVVASPFALLHHFLTWPERQNKARKRAAAAKRAAAERKRRKEQWPENWDSRWGEPPVVVTQNPNAVPVNYVYPGQQYPGHEQQVQQWPSYSYPNAPGAAASSYPHAPIH